MTQPKVLVKAGSKKVGDTWKSCDKEYKVASLGQAFTKFIPDEEACCFGLMPGSDYRIQMQYAYLEPIVGA